MRVLDAGSGHSVYLRLLAERVAPGGAVVGLDSGPEPPLAVQ